MLPEKKKESLRWLSTQNSLDPWTIFQKKNSAICWTICLGIWLFLSAENIVCGMARTTSEKIRMTFQYFRSFVSFLHGFSLHFTDNCTKCLSSMFAVSCCFSMFYGRFGQLWAMSLAFNLKHINTATLAAKNSGCQDQLAYHSQGSRNMTELSVGARCFFTYTLGDLVGILKNRSFFHQFNRGFQPCHHWVFYH